MSLTKKLVSEDEENLINTEQQYESSDSSTVDDNKDLDDDESVSQSVIVDNEQKIPPTTEDQDTGDVKRRKLSDDYPAQTTFKREEETPIDVINEVFLRSSYPLNKTMEKNVTVGMFEVLNFLPGVMINHHGKHLLFTKDYWNFFCQHTGDLEKNIFEKASGKKTRFRIPGSDIEIDNFKIYGKQYVRLRDYAQNDVKVLLTADELYLLIGVSYPISKYLMQLSQSEFFIRNFLIDTLHFRPLVPLTYTAVDPIIYNRLAEEVEFARYFRNLQREISSLNELMPQASLPPPNEAETSQQPKQDDSTLNETLV